MTTALTIEPEVIQNPTQTLTLTLEQAQHLYTELNQIHFANTLPACAIELSHRLTRTAGKIWPRAKLMRLSIPYHSHYGIEELKHTILHEMVHLWLHEQGLPNGHTPLFRQKLSELGSLERVHALPMPACPYRYLYRCPTCAYEIRTRRRISSSCGKCDTSYNPRHCFRLVQKLTP
jgi:predicted SprT family Zn-dependent metalloprotease